jgi:hypothetical protein
VNGFIHLVSAFFEVGRGLLSVKEQSQLRYSGEVRHAGVDQRPLGRRVRLLRHLVVELPRRNGLPPALLALPELPHPTEMPWIGGDLISSPDYVFNGTISSV